ncbi:hypothetical protein [Methylotuvimicrobium alcaliphilum]|uniref:Tetratricopeptide repeat protein n=1 Tax=Methylotuvimicrobium alcaliphilum (strain DSM 19304 / NCIMB 14124 / VKM B-2133 / 20Z) TaxID=1091494 RepID=G4T1G2_META2|nr:hypothetical protein [Methylotuvimicrobium alcaliphilum]CCE22384.1 conserved protein of unknown function [Methylotuvimicrobium alcaliphilum 20Z]
MKKASQKAPSAAPDASLEKNASSHFSAGRYKNAAEIYKNLLKHSDNPDWRKKLAECYLQRALNMAEKGMPKEAAVLWENYSEWAEPPLAALEAYILWLLSVKNTEKAFARLDRIDAEQLDKNHPELAVWLGFLLVCEYPGIEAHIPHDSAVMLHWQTVREALEAYRSNRLDHIDELLKKLPFRSAFRDLRSLLKAQLSLPASIEQAHTLLSKIPDNSSYRPTANALMAYMFQGSAFVEAALQLEDSQRRLIAKAKDLSNKQLELLDAIDKQHNNLTDKAQFNLAIRYRELIGNEAASRFCQAMLARYPAGRKDYLKNFAAKNSIESERIQALIHEENHDNFEAEDHWLRYIEALKTQGPESHKKIALIYRHLAQNLSPTMAIDFLIESLQYDPEDRDSYLKILDYFEQEYPDPEEHAIWLAKGLKHLPKDIEMLVCAAKSAMRKKAFKKAAKYAQDLLKIDPVNTLAKELLFSSHLAHARKLIKTQKFHLVEKELQAAEQLSIDKTLLRQADLIRGFYICAAEDKDRDLKAIADTLQSMNPGPATAHFQGFIESALMDVPYAPIAKQLPAVKAYELSEPELLHLTESIERYGEQLDLVFKALDKIKAPLKKSMKLLNYGEQVLLAWCQTLEQIEHFDLLKQCAKSADGVWEKPIWSYYRVVAECQGDPSRLDITWTLRLQNAIEIAHEQKDSKTEFKIRRFIERSIGFQNPFGFDDEDDFYEDGFDEDESGFDPDIIEGLFDHVPKRNMIKIGKKFEEMMNKSSPEQLMMDVMTKYAERVDPNQLVGLLMDPSFLVAIMMFEAAQSLRIDIDLSFDEIIEFFTDDEPFSFPFDPY